MRLLPGGLRCALLGEAVEKVLVLSGLVGPLFQLENHAVGLQSHQGVELIFCNLDAVGGQQLMGFTRVWFGHRSDRIPISRLRRTPFIFSSTVVIALLFGAACQLVLRLATISGGGLLTLLKAGNGGDLFAACSGVFGLQMVCFLGAALMTRRLDVVGFRNTVKTRFADFLK